MMSEKTIPAKTGAVESKSADDRMISSFAVLMYDLTKSSSEANPVTINEPYRFKTFSSSVNLVSYEL
jgi:hypothetical protein